MEDLQEQLDQHVYSDDEELPDQPNNVKHNRNNDVNIHENQEPPVHEPTSSNEAEKNTIPAPYSFDFQQETIDNMEKEVHDILASLDNPVSTNNEDSGTDVIDSKV